MQKRFKVEIPNTSISNIDTSENMVKATLKNTANQILCKILVFINEIQPCNKIELTERLSDFYKVPYDENNIKNYANKLLRMGMVYIIDSYSIITSTNQDELTKILKQKHSKFLEKIPLPFQKNFHNVHYFLIAPYGEKFVPWCAEQLNFKYSDTSEQKE